PAHRGFERNRDRLIQVGPALNRVLAPPRLALEQDIGEQVAERGRVGPADADAEVESFEAKARLLGTAGHGAGGIVPAPPIRIDQRLVGLGYLAEMRGRHLIAGIDIRVIFPRQTLVRPLDVRGRRAPLQTEDDVEIHNAQIGRYCFPSSTTSASMTSPVFVPAPPGCGPPCAAPPAPPAPPGAPPGALPAACCRYSASAALCCAAVS